MHQGAYHARSRAGFTLIELLVVIGIIAVIAAILFPVFARSRERARQAACLSNERQVGAAFLLYAQDSDGVVAPNIESRPPIGVFWPQLVSPYVRADACFVCPDADPARDTLHQLGPNGQGTVVGWPQGVPGPPRVSYAYNLNIGGILWSSVPSDQDAVIRAGFTPKTLAQIARPAATVLLTDGGTKITRGTPEEWPEKDRPALDLRDAEYAIGLAGEAAPSARHDGRTDVLYADGHVRAQRVASFYMGLGTHSAGEKYPGMSPCLDPALGCPD